MSDEKKELRGMADAWRELGLTNEAIEKVARESLLAVESIAAAIRAAYTSEALAGLHAQAAGMVEATHAAVRAACAPEVLAEFRAQYAAASIGGRAFASLGARAITPRAPELPKLSREKIAEFGALLVVVNLAPDEDRAAAQRAMRGDDPALLAEIRETARSLIRLWLSAQQSVIEHRQRAEGPEELDTIA